MKETVVTGISLMRNENFLKRHCNPNTDNNLYPSMDKLRNRIAEYHNVLPEQVLLGAGITGLFRTIVRQLHKTNDFDVPKNFYIGLRSILGEFDAEFSADGEVALYTHPANPDGTFVRELKPNKEIHIVDEAYIEYYPHEESFVSKVDTTDGLIVMRSFSKAHGMAGIRVGYAIVSPDLAWLGDDIYTIPSHSIECAIHCLNSADSTIPRVVEANEISKRYLLRGLENLGVHVKVSCANFVIAKVPDVPGFHVRYLFGYDGYDGYKRISTADISVMDSYLNALEGVLEEIKEIEND